MRCAFNLIEDVGRLRSNRGEVVRSSDGPKAAVHSQQGLKCLLERNGNIMSVTTLIIVIAAFLLLFGGGGGYYWSRRR